METASIFALTVMRAYWHNRSFLPQTRNDGFSLWSDSKAFDLGKHSSLKTPVSALLSTEYYHAK